MDGPSHPVHESDIAGAKKSASTAADAAVLDLRADQASLNQSAELHDHPSKTRDDEAFETMLPAVAVIAAQKNIALDGDGAPLLACALQYVPRRTLHRVLKGDEAAIESIKLEINRALDEFMTVRLAYAMLVMEGHEPTVDMALTLAKSIPQVKAANDRAETLRVWPDLADEIEAHYARLARARVTVTVPSRSNAQGEGA